MDADDALGVLHLLEDLTGRNPEALGHDLEVVDQRFHGVTHDFADVSCRVALTIGANRQLRGPGNGRIVHHDRVRSAVATFYSQYKRKPNGSYTVGVCTNTLCAVMGGDDIFDAVSTHLGLGNDETTPGGEVTLERIECNAACDYAPVVMVNWEFFDNQTPESTVELVDSLVAGTPVTASRGPVVQDFKHVSRVLAGFEDDLVDEGGAGGAATMVGLEIARKHHWHAPAYSGSETADASNAEVGDAHVGEANSSADRATSAGAPKDLEKGKDV